MPPVASLPCVMHDFELRKEALKPLLVEHERPIVAAINPEQLHIGDGLDVQQSGHQFMGLPFHQVDGITVLQQAGRQPRVATGECPELLQRHFPPVVPVQIAAFERTGVPGPM